MSDPYDVAVLGATAAGYVSATGLADLGHRVVLVDAPCARAEAPRSDWVPSDAFAGFAHLKQLKSAALDAPFKAVQFHSEDLSAHSAYRARSVLGYRLRSDALLAALEKIASRRGVRRIVAKAAPRVELEESRVVLTGKQTAAAALLLITQGLPSEAVADLSLPLRPSAGGGMSVLGLEAPVTKPSGRKVGNDLHVAAFRTRPMLGMFFRTSRAIHVRIVVAGEPPTGDELGLLTARLQQAGFLPSKFDLRAGAVSLWRPPGGAALEQEVLLAKRTLLIGTAGGFASAVSGQTIYPSVRSALVAVEVAHRALTGRESLQETLGEFKTRWRDALADRIRPPGASLQMLLPMVLSNRAIAAKFARLLLYGESL